MKPRVLRKKVSIDETEYELSKPDARTACWLFSFLGAKIEVSGGSIFSALGKCTRAEFDEVQDIALKHTFFLDSREGNTFPTAVLDPRTGGWVDKKLGEDADSLMKLTSEYLAFVLEPFLAESGSNSQK